MTASGRRAVTAVGSRRRSRQLGLRARVTVAFALGALSLSLILSALTYGLVRSNLVQQRESSARAQAFVNARVARDGMRQPGGGGLTRALGSMESRGRGGVVVHVDDRWFATSIVVGRDLIPAAMRDRVAGGQPAQQRFVVDGEPWLVVGVPIPQVSAEFFEAFSLAEVERILDVLSYSLAGAALLTTMAGAGVGRWASGRVLRPLASVSEAAAAIADGALDTRLAPPSDRDLAPLAASFNSMVDALSDRIEKDARFASDVSHELRSPLTTLSTSLDVLRARREELPPRSQAALDLLDADVRRFRRMVEDLLEISRFDAGVAELEVEEVDLRDLVRHTIAAQPGCERVPLRVEGVKTADGSVVLGDKRRLERVVANLVENAAAYGGGATAVKVERHDGKVRVVVEDAGGGVPPLERTKVFERFFRGSASGRRGTGGGSGLGLALVAEHVHLHGGDVWVEDGANGVGARFVVELPAATP